MGNGARLAARLPEPRVQLIEGQSVLVIERRPPLQPSLEALRRAMVVTYELPLRRTGPRAACLTSEHRLIHFLSGRHLGTDAVVRELRLLMCADCEAVCVRDVSHDSLTALDPAGRGAARPSRLAPRRRDRVLGWYSGARLGQRTYHPMGGTS